MEATVITELLQGPLKEFIIFGTGLGGMAGAAIYAFRTFQKKAAEPVPLREILAPPPPCTAIEMLFRSEREMHEMQLAVHEIDKKVDRIHEIAIRLEDRSRTA